MSSDPDFDAILAQEIKRGDNIEFPPNDPGVTWRIDETRATKPPCDQPGVLWYVEEQAEPMLGSPLGDLYIFTVKEVGAGAEVEVRVRGHVTVRRSKRDRG
ncbi:hypothetical protein [Mycobacterium parmense]|uniref:hypothetical protein n=1 Tax=Mycobacterium parmense TaxID=185642 RepID=UPI00111BE6E0|nr:hypothetical protein [Mycobacterium parmense]MCV7353653.1 hypothetical protein [Mycobacterium parmense]